jgi:threonine aldolase
MVSRLGEDHERARRLSRGLAANPAVQLDADVPATNMVFFRIRESVGIPAIEVEAQLKKQGILVSATGPRRFRLVTHYWINDAAVDKTVAAYAAALN